MSSDIVKDKLGGIMMPILIAIIGYFLIKNLEQISTDIKELQTINKERDDWIRDWTEKWQPVLDYAKHQKENNERL